MTDIGPDLAPTLPSRVVTIDALKLGEDIPQSGTVTFALTCDLHDPTSDKIITAPGRTVELLDGKGSIRLPIYSTAIKTQDGSTDWGVVVTKSWHPHHPYMVRVPAGQGDVSLADLAPVRPLRGREKQYALTSVAVSLEEGTLGGSGTVSNGVLNLTLRFPRADWKRGDAAAGIDWNTMRGWLNSGVWSVANSAAANAMSSLPVKSAGQMQVLSTTGGYTTQIYTTWGPDAGTYVRHSSASGPGDTSANWTEWGRLGAAGQVIPNGTDLTNFRRTGVWRVATSTNAATITGLPDGATSGALVQYGTGSGLDAVVRVWYDTASGPWFQSMDTANSTQGNYRWLAWQPMGGGGAQASAAQATPPSVTLGRGGVIESSVPVVALRFDHHVDDFFANLHPILSARGIPASLALFVGQWEGGSATYTERATMTAAAVADMCRKYGYEPLCHSWTHEAGDMQREIVESRKRLSELLELPVTGWAQPGIGSTAWGGLTADKSPTVWADNPAGRLIASNYAHCSGGGGRRWPLGDRLGIALDGVEAWTASQVTTILDDFAADTYPTAMQMMWHPHVTDLSQFTAVVDKLVALRDAGKIRIVTVGAIPAMKPGSAPQRDLLAGASAIATSKTVTVDWWHQGYPWELVGTLAAPADITINGATISHPAGAFRRPFLAGATVRISTTAQIADAKMIGV